MFKTSLLLLIILLGGLVFSGCSTGTTVVPKGWSGGVIDNGILFVGSMQGKLVAANITASGPPWTAPLETEESTSGGLFSGCARAPTTVAIYGSPAVSGDLVYVAGYDGKVRAFVFEGDGLRQEPRWYSRLENISGTIVGGLVVADDKVYYGTSGGQVYAVDAADGHRIWVFSPQDQIDKIWSTPAIYGDTLYIGSFDKKLYAIDTTTGKGKWEKPFESGGAIVSTPAVDGNSVYFGSFDRYVYAIDSTNGSLRWKSKFMAENWFWAKPVVYDDTIYAACLDGKVYALKADTGEKLDEFDLGSPISSSPVLVGNLIIVATEDGGVFALDTDSNQQRPPVSLEEKVYAPLTASQGKVYIHTATDKLYEIDVQSGAKRELNIK